MESEAPLRRHVGAMYQDKPRVLSAAENDAITRQCITRAYPDDMTPVKTAPAARCDPRDGS